MIEFFQHTLCEASFWLSIILYVISIMALSNMFYYLCCMPCTKLQGQRGQESGTIQTFIFKSV